MEMARGRRSGIQSEMVQPGEGGGKIGCEPCVGRRALTCTRRGTLIVWNEYDRN